MMRVSLLLGVALLASCAATSEADLPEPPKPPAVPAGLRSCPQGTPLPLAPLPPRTIEQVAAWARATALAASQTEQARNVCARRLEALNAWIVRHH